MAASISARGGGIARPQALKLGSREISAKLMTWTSRKAVLGFLSTLVVCGILAAPAFWRVAVVLNDPRMWSLAIFATGVHEGWVGWRAHAPDFTGVETEFRRRIAGCRRR